MNFVWTENPDRLADRAAVIVAGLLREKPDAAIALPTGSTPLGMYRALVDLKRSGEFSCEAAHFFNLDEFSGKSIRDPQSYAAFLWTHFFSPLGVDPAQVRLLDGNAADPKEECRAFEEAIDAVGGLDLVILGLGRNGHVAFNEPGSDWKARTRQVPLTAETRDAQRVLYDDPRDVPTSGLTMGIPTILSARSILLLVSGEGKTAAVEALLRGAPDIERSVTAILGHPSLTVLADEALRPSRNVFAA